MTRQEFGDIFKVFVGGFPNWRPGHPLTVEDVAASYFSALGKYRSATVAKAMEHISAGREFMPPASAIAEECRAILLSAPQASFRKKLRDLERFPHNCSSRIAQAEQFHGQGKKISEAMAWLSMVSPDSYEALHVYCGGDCRSTCPYCAYVHDPMEHSVIRWCIDRWPNETRDWNPLAKGWQVCRGCDGQ